MNKFKELKPKAAWEPKEGDECPWCIEKKLDPPGTIEFIGEDFPWSTDHYQCSKCCSTFCIR